MKNFILVLLVVTGSLFVQSVKAQDLCGTPGHDSCPIPSADLPAPASTPTPIPHSH